MLVEHKDYFRQLKEDNKYLLLVFLIPSFLAGWKEGGKIDSQKQLSKSGKKRMGGFNRFAKFMFHSALSMINPQRLLK
ncbi:hypothetical protein [Legionella cardiaca]|uniref:Transposase n=1 Tax=Legionella cardiaca TaxID=1071983 RepID=A0ABY8ASQ4_9GAMM|nr:hypothetical protein [Legionella cardiaca]WED43698.1 hypothetical protein PXX05_02670 [Legionella cardiaca]